MNVYEYIKIAFIKCNTNERQVALKMNETPQNINRKIKSDMKISFLHDVADALDCDIEIRFIKRTNNEPL